MRAGRPGLRKAIQPFQQQLRTNINSVWITDDTLRQTLLCFIHRTRSIRHGSSVPGPLESRKRAKGRRMTQLSNPTPPSAPGFLGFWNVAGPVKKEEWCWEPPSPRIEPHIQYPSIPPLPPPPPPIPITSIDSYPISEHSIEPASIKLANERRREKFKGSMLWDIEVPFEKTIFRLQELLTSKARSYVDELCSTFVQNVRRRIISGTMTDESLKRCLRMYYGIIFRAHGCQKEANKYSLMLCHAIWSCHKTSQTHSTDTIGVSTLKALSELLVQITSQSEAQSFTLKILNEVPKDRVWEVRGTVARLVKTWSHGLEDSKLFGTTSSYNFHLDKKAHMKFQLVQRIDSLANFLDQLPERLSNRTIKLLTRVLMKYLIVQERTSGHQMLAEDCSLAKAKRFFWMLTLAKSRCVSETLFIDTYNYINKFSQISSLQSSVLFRAKLPPFSEKEVCLILLEHLISNEMITQPAGARTRVLNSLQTGSESLAGQTMMHILNAYGTAVTSFLKLVQLSSPEKAYHILWSENLSTSEKAYQILWSVRRESGGMSEDSLALIVHDIAEAQPYLAWQILKASTFLCNGQDRPLAIEEFPHLVRALIRHESIKPETVWGILFRRFPYRRQLARLQRLQPPPPGLVHLIHEMADEFRSCLRFSEEEAFRNVARCVAFLRRFGAPIKPSLSEAVVQSGMLQAFKRHNWSGYRVANWILKVVEEGEGSDAADKVHQMMRIWQEQSRRRFVRSKFSPWHPGKAPRVRKIRVRAQPREMNFDQLRIGNWQPK